MKDGTVSGDVISLPQAIKKIEKLENKVAALKNDKSGKLLTKEVQVVWSGSGRTTIDAPDVDGYTFLVWVSTTSVKTVRSVYTNTPLAKNNAILWAYNDDWDNGINGVLAIALYIKND